MNIAQASLEECRYYLILSKDLGYGDTSQLMSQLEEVSKLLEAYTASILNSGARMERKPAEDFRDLIVWQKAHQYVLSTYHFSDSFPKKEIYGLTSQMRRSAISIPANIAEGFKKRLGRIKSGI